MRGILGLSGLALVFFVTGCGVSAPDKSEETRDKAPNWSAPRTWSSRDGRTLEGTLVARMKQDGVIRRTSDHRVLRMPPSLLDDEGRGFLTQAVASGTLATTLSDVWYVKTTLTIPGGETYMTADSTVAVGPRIAKVETSYWLLLTELDGSGAKWARVDNHSFSKLRAEALVMRSDLVTQMNGSGHFIDEVSCPRTDCYVIDARYGLTSRRVNVTRQMMGHLAGGALPVKVTPELFSQPGHAPDVWDLTITWQRNGEGTLNRVVRDESILAWP
jgi:hypothetical protein